MNRKVLLPEKRKLKVYYGHHGNNYRRHPVIRLGGDYLEKMNFKVGDIIDIHIEENRILITKHVSMNPA